MNNKWLIWLMVAGVFFSVPASALDQESVAEDNNSLVANNPDEAVDEIDGNSDEFATDATAAQEIQDNTDLVNGVKTVDEIDRD